MNEQMGNMCLSLQLPFSILLYLDRQDSYLTMRTIFPVISKFSFNAYFPKMYMLNNEFPLFINRFLDGLMNVDL